MPTDTGERTSSEHGHPEQGLNAEIPAAAETDQGHLYFVIDLDSAVVKNGNTGAFATVSPNVADGVDSGVRTVKNGFAQQGLTAERPADPPLGHRFYDITLGQCLWWNGTGWSAAANSDSATDTGERTVRHGFQEQGPTSERPTNCPVGFEYFDTTICEPIWWNGDSWKVFS